MLLLNTYNAVEMPLDSALYKLIIDTDNDIAYDLSNSAIFQ